MKTYDVLDLRRQCEQNLRSHYPGHSKEFREMTTVVVSSDFCKYVAAMAEAWPDQTELPWPSKADAHWPFMGQSVLFVFEETIYIEFLLISHTTEVGVIPLDHPQPDEQPVIAMCLLDSRATGSVIIRSPEGEFVARHGDLPIEIQPQHSLFVHPPFPFVTPGLGFREGLITDGNFAWGVTVHKHDDHPYLGYAARWERSFVEAVGHRMSMLSEPHYERMPRPERRAIQRTGVPYRLLQLRTPERATESTGTTHVNWSKRWAVRGHWRNQPYGPRDNPTYRQKWIDPYIKGPEDMPLDIRPTVFNLGGRPQDPLT